MSFVRKAAASAGDVLATGARAGPHGTSLVSSGLADLDEIIGGGIPVGGIVMVMEDLEAPHHMLLMRYFMAQGLVHGQRLLFASPLPSPRSFLGTLPGLATGEEHKSSRKVSDSQGEDLRIAWQYRRYLSEQQALTDRRLRQQELRASSMYTDNQLPSSGHRREYSTQFDLRKPLDRTLWSTLNTECLSLQDGTNFASLQEKCATFLGSLARTEGGGHQVGRVALQSLCAPLCMVSSDWELLAFLHGLKSRLREARAVGFVTFPSALLKSSISARWQHLSDILLSVEAIRDDDKEMESMFTGYKDMVGFLRVHKVATINSQVPRVPEVGPFAIKVLQKKKVVLERLHLAPIDGSVGKGGGASSLLCAQPANAPSVLDF